MPQMVRIDLAAEEVPSLGEIFVIALQENSEMLGMLDGDRTFRFVDPSAAERRYQEAGRVLSILALDLKSPASIEPRLIGALMYDEASTS